MDFIDDIGVIGLLMCINSSFVTQHFNRTTKNGSNGRANSIHMIGGGSAQSPTDNGAPVVPRHRELQQMIRDRINKFTTERAMFSLWIFPPNDK